MQQAINEMHLSFFPLLRRPQVYQDRLLREGKIPKEQVRCAVLCCAVAVIAQQTLQGPLGCAPPLHRRTCTHFS